MQIRKYVVQFVVPVCFIYSSTFKDKDWVWQLKGGGRRIKYISLNAAIDVLKPRPAPSKCKTPGKMMEKVIEQSRRKKNPIARNKQRRIDPIGKKSWKALVNIQAVWVVVRWSLVVVNTGCFQNYRFEKDIHWKRIEKKDCLKSLSPLSEDWEWPCLMDK